MIPADIQVVDLGGENWSRLLTILGELALSRAPRREDALLVVYRGLKLLKAVDLSRGYPVKARWHGCARLELLARESGYPRIIALEESALSRIAGHAQRELDLRDDYLDQWRAFLKGLALEWRRTVFTWPPGPPLIPVPPRGTAGLLLRALVPDDTLVLLAVSEKGRAWASVALGCRDCEVHLVTSLDAVGMEGSDLSEGGLEEAARALSGEFGGRVRAAVIERDALRRAAASRFPAAAILWALNTGELRLLDFPLRWKVFWLIALTAAGLPRSTSGVRHLP